MTKDDIITCGEEIGKTSFIRDNCTMYIHKNIYIKKYQFEFSINIGFKDDITDWNDFDNVLLIDEDFCQPYTPFYENWDKKVSDFPVLEECIRSYNNFMDSLPFFVEKEC